METKNCPRCDSPNPKKHPAIQFEGEVQICSHPWHTEMPTETAELCQCGATREEHKGYGEYRSMYLTGNRATNCKKFAPPNAEKRKYPPNLSEKEIIAQQGGISGSSDAVSEKALETQIVFGWRQHCTSGELKDGELRKDFSDYRIGYTDGHSAASEESRQEIERLKEHIKELESEIEGYVIENAGADY